MSCRCFVAGFCSYKVTFSKALHLVSLHSAFILLVACLGRKDPLKREGNTICNVVFCLVNKQTEPMDTIKAIPDFDHSSWLVVDIHSGIQSLQRDFFRKISFRALWSLLMMIECFGSKGDLPFGHSMAITSTQVFCDGLFKHQSTFLLSFPTLPYLLHPITSTVFNSDRQRKSAQHLTKSSRTRRSSCRGR